MHSSGSWHAYGLCCVTRCRMCQVTGPLLFFRGTVCLCCIHKRVRLVHVQDLYAVWFSVWGPGEGAVNQET